MIVFVLEGTTIASRSHRSVGGWVNVAAGVAALAAAAALRARPPRPSQAGSWSARVERGGVYAFAAGVLLNVFPGIFPFVALRNIAALDAGDGAKVALVVLLYVIMFTLVEVPLLGLLFAPARVEPAVGRLNAWLDRNGRRVATGVLALAGVALIVRGLLQI